MLKALFRKVGELSPSCREATRLQSEALDRPLGLGPRLGLRLHLLLCKWCRRYGKQIGFLRSAARQRPEREDGMPRQTLRPEARERIKRCLQSKDK